MEKDSSEHDAAPRRGRTIAIALNGGSKSKFIVKWSIEKFFSEENVVFKLLHVYPKISGVPTPMGNLLPLSQVRDDVAAAYKKEIEWQTTEIILPFQKLFNFKQVEAEIVLIESDDIANGISTEIAKHGIKDLVVGASNNGMFARRIKGQLLSSIISECAPNFCTVYVVSKGKLECLRPPNETFREYDSSTCDSTNSSSRYTNSTFDPGSASSESPAGSPPSTKDSETDLDEKNIYKKTVKTQTKLTSSSFADARDVDDAFSSSNGSLSSHASTFISANSDGDPQMLHQLSLAKPSNVPDQVSVPSSHLASSTERQTNINLELEKLRIELRHIRGMYAIAQNETIDATRRLSDLSKLRHEEAMKLKELSEKEERAKELAKLENEKFEAAKREAEYARVCVEREALQRIEAEQKAARDSKEKEKLKSKLGENVPQYQKFTWEEIISATCNFNEKLKIGEGSYGAVYKCRLHHTTVAVKVLHSKEGTNDKQFHKELEILSKIRHPHLLLLLGACPEHGCLVYEYMEKGSLEDRLFRKNKTPPITWFERFRIAWEVASALAFLHNNKPKSIIHRDLKPANILLDHNFVSKIGDAGLCTMLNLLDSSSTMSNMTLYKDTSPVGTLCYIDPEYQRTGLISTKSDVYALGMVILQLLTAKPVVGIAHVVEDAIKERRLMDILDKDAGRWPVREAVEMAILGVQCAELRRRDRPDLNNKILPILERMKDIADKAREMANAIQMAPPNHFICPILEDVMEDPCVASDGYTYDRKAIELWLKDNDTSPTTNFPLANKNLIPNYNLRYAIQEWKSKAKLTQ